MASSILGLQDVFFCAVCDTPLDEVEWFNSPDSDEVIVTFHCHGETERVRVSREQVEDNSLGVELGIELVRFRSSLTAERIEQMVTLLESQVKTMNMLDIFANTGANAGSFLGTVSGSGQGGSELSPIPSPILEQSGLDGSGEAPTVICQGIEMHLGDFSYNFERCRDLLDGMRIERIIIGEEEYESLKGLLTGHARWGFSFGPFRMLHQSYITWREIRLYPSSQKIMALGNAKFTTGSFDISAVPFIYRNQKGIDLQFYPPWYEGELSRTGGTTKTETAGKKTSGRRIILPQKERGKNGDS